MFDKIEFRDALIHILDPLQQKLPNAPERYLLDTTAKTWGGLVYVNIILAHLLPATMPILTRALVETRNAQIDSCLRSIERIAREKDTADWFVGTIFFPTLERSSGRQSNTDGRRFTSSEEETFPKNLLAELAEFRTSSEITEAMENTRVKRYASCQDRAEAIRKKLGILGK